MQEWVEKDGKLCKIFTFRNFAEAMAFMVRVSYKAEAMNHHPEWTNIYNKVFVELITHDSGKVTDLDRKLAEFMDVVFARTHA